MLTFCQERICMSRNRTEQLMLLMPEVAKKAQKIAELRYDPESLTEYGYFHRLFFFVCGYLVHHGYTTCDDVLCDVPLHECVRIQSGQYLLSVAYQEAVKHMAFGICRGNGLTIHCLRLVSAKNGSLHDGMNQILSNLDEIPMDVRQEWLLQSSGIIYGNWYLYVVSLEAVTPGDFLSMDVQEQQYSRLCQILLGSREFRTPQESKWRCFACSADMRGVAVNGILPVSFLLNLELLADYVCRGCIRWKSKSPLKIL